MGVLPAHVFEGIEVPGGRETGFGAGNVESGDLLIAKFDAQFAISRDRAACRMAVSSIRARITCPASAAAMVPAATPSSTARTTSSRVRLRSVCNSGANRISA
jgi:hypothetical protein